MINLSVNIYKVTTRYDGLGSVSIFTQWNASIIPELSHHMTTMLNNTLPYPV